MTSLIQNQPEKLGKSKNNIVFLTSCKRINLYVPKIIVKLIDYLAKDTSRGELVTRLVVKEVSKNKKTPYGMFSGVEVSDSQIEKITSQ